MLIQIQIQTLVTIAILVRPPTRLLAVTVTVILALVLAHLQTRLLAHHPTQALIQTLIQNPALALRMSHQKRK
ncbi:hypothetical protein BX070DRAFT_226103 [Coemansia spiralis]|nr:hypothetical protein BX070DRAFT_226103 [Coemansia spiralis]